MERFGIYVIEYFSLSIHAVYFVFQGILLPIRLKVSDCSVQCVYKVCNKNNGQLKCKQCDSNV